jgi:DNA-binding HxlR family transcriptional regulator
MTTTEICKAARSLSPRIQLRDIWLILREMGERGLVICLNPRHMTGKLYSLTKRGRRVVKQTFGIEVPQIPQHIDWRKYSRVVRAKVRRLVLLEVARLSSSKPVTATEVRRSLRGRHPLGLNPTIRALKELERMGLTRSVEVNQGTGRRAYALTHPGAAIANASQTSSGLDPDGHVSQASFGSPRRGGCRGGLHSFAN